MAPVYVASYILLSRTSMKLLEGHGGNGFYYVPCGLETMASSSTAQTLHIFGVYAFYPIWKLDHSLGGPSFGSIPLDRLE
jgi:hypothetical protein